MSDTAGSRNDGAVDQLLLEAGMDDDGQAPPRPAQPACPGGGGPGTLGRDCSTDGRPDSCRHHRAARRRTGRHHRASRRRTRRRTGCLHWPRKTGRRVAARRRTKRRITLTTLSVAASLAAGGAMAAASDQGFRDSISQLNHAVTSFVTGSTAAPAGDGAKQVPVPAPAAPRPSATSSADAVPPAPAPASAPAVVPPSGVPARQGNTPTHTAPSQKPAEIPSEPALPTGVPGDVRKGLEQGPKLPVPLPTEIPLPGKAQDVPLK
ncbi:hypothetical protein NG819_05325 [Pseudarthrobacter sp. Fe7]|nr:hypothetical protein NG819_05325 [Pseudarthrobacter sp. Fe7]